MMASIGATNVHMACDPFEEESQQLHRIEDIDE